MTIAAISARTVLGMLALFALGGASRVAGAQSTPPSTDVFLAPISVRGARVTVGRPVNITRRPGYDNQPSFTPDGRSILFTSVREDGQADIYRYDIHAKTTTRVTRTPESEYSATVTPAGDRFSVVRVEADSAQRLWSFALDGSAPELVLERVKPVGYHVWLDRHTLGLYVLGKPSTLQLADSWRGDATVVATDIGRSLQAVPGTPVRALSFVQRNPEKSDSTWRLSVLDLDLSREGRWVVAKVAHLPAGSEFVAWLDARRVLTAQDGKLLMMEVGGPEHWREVADLTPYGVRHVSRLAVSRDGRSLALVADDAITSARPR